MKLSKNQGQLSYLIPLSLLYDHGLLSHAAQVKAKLRAGEEVAGLFERSEFPATPRHAILQGKPKAKLPGVFFFWFFSFGQAKEKNNKLKVTRFKGDFNKKALLGFILDNNGFSLK